MLGWLYPLGGLLALFGLASAGTGPSALYNALNGQTFNPPGYTIVMYQSCMQNQNAGNSCGSFSTFESSNGVYTNQLYGPASIFVDDDYNLFIADRTNNRILFITNEILLS